MIIKDDPFHYYKVFKNQTSVTRVSANDFKPGSNNRNYPPHTTFHLPADSCMYYGYADKTDAMNNAKAGALIHINRLLGKGELGLKELAQYRIDHYDDLNITLLKGNINKRTAT
ncbi:MAG: hypothetical protein K0S09_3232 [Sphingobacteriaceae bacterium]|jgi:hypothetical protein|nr:hypothetical protein [Sphingobacteriaceae bacterium]